MGGVKRALLIGCPTGGLEGPQNDVDLMARALARHGFKIFELCGDTATRESILNTWDALIHETQSSDALAVYYSGHGGYVEQPRPERDVDVSGPLRRARDYRFIVPSDYDARNVSDFRGILDIELAKLVSRSTAKTKNVTIILDCCFSGRVCRNTVMGGSARLRMLLPTRKISEVRGALKNAGYEEPDSDLYVLGNPNAVKIYATSESTAAWECQDEEGRYFGLFTKPLAQAINAALDTDTKVSWKTTLIGVSRTVALIGAGVQQPFVDGPSDRFHFSLERASSVPFEVRTTGNGYFLNAGSILCVQVGDRYSLMPAGSEGPSPNPLGFATVTAVQGMSSTVDLSPRTLESGEGISDGVILAFPDRLSAPICPILLPSERHDLENVVRDSKLLRIADPKDLPPNIQIHEGNGQLTLMAWGGTRIVTEDTRSLQGDFRETYRRLIERADKLARASRLLAFRQGYNSPERLQHNVQIGFGRVVPGGRRSNWTMLSTDGTARVKVNDRVFLSLLNCGTTPVYATVLEIDPAGNIQHFGLDYGSLGYCLDPGKVQVIGETPADLRGLTIQWVPGIPNNQPIWSIFLVILSDSSVDLRCLDNRKTAVMRGGSRSALEELASELVEGNFRLSALERDTVVQWDILRVSCTICQLYETGPENDSAGDILFVSSREGGLTATRHLQAPETAMQAYPEPGSPPWELGGTASVLRVSFRDIPSL
jgi:hypothetical protein